MGQTADGPFDPATNNWSETLVSLNPRTLTLKDYFVPPNIDMLNYEDLDFGSGGPVAISYKGRNYVVTGGKDGTLYILDAKNLGGDDHKTPLFSLKTGNDELSYAGHGFWGALATTVDARANAGFTFRCGDLRRRGEVRYHQRRCAGRPDPGLPV